MNLLKVNLDGTNKNKKIDAKKHYLVAIEHANEKGTLYYRAGQFEKRDDGGWEFDVGIYYLDLEDLERVWEIQNPPTKTKIPPPPKKRVKKVPESACNCRPCPEGTDDMFWRQDEERNCPYHSQPGVI